MRTPAWGLLVGVLLPIGSAYITCAQTDMSQGDHETKKRCKMVNQEAASFMYSKELPFGIRVLLLSSALTHKLERYLNGQHLHGIVAQNRPSEKF